MATAPQGYDSDVAEATPYKAADSSFSPGNRTMITDSMKLHSHSLDNDRIKRWQETAVTCTEEQDTGIIARLCRAVLDSLAFFLPIFSVETINKRDTNVLRRCHATLKLWAEGHGVPTGNLDFILDQSKHLRCTTISILRSLCIVMSVGINRYQVRTTKKLELIKICEDNAEVCDQAKVLLSNFNESLNDSDSSDGDTSDDDAIESGINDVVEDVKTYTSCLLDLSAAFECPARDVDKEDGPTIVNVEERAAHDYHTQLLLAKFPSAQMELIDRLGETSWNRYQRMVRERELNANAQMQAKLHTSQHKETKSLIADSEFQDSGLGTSLPSASSLSQDEPLHLFRDLQPYTCFYANCSWSTTPFADRQLWSKHLELDHEFGSAWNALQCPLCLNTTEQGKSAILTHFARHMEDIALAALPRDVESDAESDISSECTPSKVERPPSPSTYRELCDEKYHCELFNDIANERETEGESDQKSCKFFEFTEDHWKYRGAGYYSEGSTHIFVNSENSSTPILTVCVTTDCHFRWTHETVLAWTKPSGVAMALAFQSVSTSEDCKRFILGHGARTRLHILQEGPVHNKTKLSSNFINGEEEPESSRQAESQTRPVENSDPVRNRLPCSECGVFFHGK
ncbi:hypothetical protein PTNB73_01877 [Pyrenophora teres f. teres]|nr:hypothetical protein HRS9139_00463 [Pyrenophora teres f. teres]KAE8848034.1 hypothetical protein PTNB85_01877 [Pyrenophora teres f. teres]KAE8853803.1 hypothetical protein HRS9122_00795 [Pyrenophora teres f. teres]KAE8872726.1 hypothetical protein PTNB73_01877 [Pyrenophora teres f. teres]